MVTLYIDNNSVCLFYYWCLLYCLVKKDKKERMARLEDEYSWSPPTESELKVIEARRERNDKISSLMGQYLLKGYKMLATVCPTCDCVLLEDRRKVKYCIGCSEVDADTKKDNPAVSEEAARKTVEEIQHRQSTVETSSTTTLPQHTTESSTPAEATQSCITSLVPTSTCTSNRSSKFSVCVHGVDLTSDVGAAVTVLKDKLVWATSQLNATNSVHEANNISELITNTCRAIATLRDL
ncbi:hypothetical protein Pmani_030142 [Petrolisthes manimaculis]|uniref:Sjoegren syndrome/scleroderma autoantigen 1 n=1 Tax=Petrolisthes manimaculis TaxID=1843537 RepID=A0AAE1NY44_9EUCA|nr:hypothetical protein Pmani_030142 [Petrolisthes manimaculis]